MEVSYDVLIVEYLKSKEAYVAPILEEGNTDKYIIKLPVLNSTSLTKESIWLKNHIVDVYRNLHNKYPQLLGIRLCIDEPVMTHTIKIEPISSKVLEITDSFNSSVLNLDHDDLVFVIPNREAKRHNVGKGTEITFARVFDEVHFIRIGN